MQERNIHDKTLVSRTLDTLASRAFLNKNTTSIVTSRIPKRETIIRINDLDYKVISNDYAKGTFKAKLVNFNKEK